MIGIYLICIVTIRVGFAQYLFHLINITRHGVFLGHITETVPRIPEQTTQLPAYLITHIQKVYKNLYHLAFPITSQNAGRGLEHFPRLACLNKP